MGMTEVVYIFFSRKIKCKIELSCQMTATIGAKWTAVDQFEKNLVDIQIY